MCYIYIYLWCEINEVKGRNKSLEGRRVVNKLIIITQWMIIKLLTTSRTRNKLISSHTSINKNRRISASRKGKVKRIITTTVLDK